MGWEIHRAMVQQRKDNYVGQSRRTMITWDRAGGTVTVELGYDFSKFFSRTGKNRGGNVKKYENHTKTTPQKR